MCVRYVSGSKMRGFPVTHGFLSWTWWGSLVGEWKLWFCSMSIRHLFFSVAKSLTLLKRLSIRSVCWAFYRCYWILITILQNKYLSLVLQIGELRLRGYLPGVTEQQVNCQCPAIHKLCDLGQIILSLWLGFTHCKKMSDNSVYSLGEFFRLIGLTQCTRPAEQRLAYSMHTVSISCYYCTLLSSCSVNNVIPSISTLILILYMASLSSLHPSHFLPLLIPPQLSVIPFPSSCPHCVYKALFHSLAFNSPSPPPSPVSLSVGSLWPASCC